MRNAIPTKETLINSIINFFQVSDIDSLCLMDCRKTFKSSENDFKIIGVAMHYFTYLVNGEIEFGDFENLSIKDLEELDNILCDERHNQLEMGNDPNNATWFNGNKKDYLPVGY